MAERQIGHQKSCLVLSARFPVANWGSRPVAKSACYIKLEPLGLYCTEYCTDIVQKFNAKFYRRLFGGGRGGGGTNFPPTPAYKRL